MMKEQKNFLFFSRKRMTSLLKRIVGCVVYRVCSFVLRQDKLVLYSASPNNNFGNIESLAIWFNNHNINYIHTTQQEMILSPVKFFTKLASAKVLVIDAGSPASRVSLTSQTILIHCWHAGGAYKKIGFDAKRKDVDESKEEARIKRIHRNIAYFVCTSKKVAEIYAKAFRLRLEQMLVFGLPRLDTCLARTYQPVVPTVLYAPTYRTRQNGQRYLPQTLDMQLLRKLFLRTGESMHFAFRGHPTLTAPEIEGWEDWSNIPQNEALSKASILITDYSSVFFDFLPYKRPVVFYVPDIEDYQKHERELYFSPYDEFPETTCGDMERLLAILQQCQNKPVDYSNFWNRYMHACDGHSTERICAFILENMKGGAI